MAEKKKRKRSRQKKTAGKRKAVPSGKKRKKAVKKSTAGKSAKKRRAGKRPVVNDSRLGLRAAEPLRKTPTSPREPMSRADLDKISPEFPCICPGQKYPITRAVCLGRQERDYEKCSQCRYQMKGRRPRKRVLEEE